MKPSIRSLCFVLTSIFLGGKKKISIFPLKNIRMAVFGFKHPKTCLEVQQTQHPRSGGSLLALLPGLDFVSGGFGPSLCIHLEILLFSAP